MLDRLYAIKRPLEYQEVLQKDHLIRCLTKLPGIDWLDLILLIVHKIIKVGYSLLGGGFDSHNSNVV